jgi:hypothetical protein
MVFVELGNDGFESELAAGNLQPLDEIGGAGRTARASRFPQGQSRALPQDGFCRRPVAQTTVNWRRC